MNGSCHVPRNDCRLAGIALQSNGVDGSIMCVFVFLSCPNPELNHITATATAFAIMERWVAGTVYRSGGILVKKYNYTKMFYVFQNLVL